ncbi:PREDICTED: uncharacterized protein LOC106331446 [Brassica oleracea var. oleracea]|uniref:uncharacterized protein LOC106331446 n=1 Tax=Brassica oleracea var. oleracea TaxID=109376 RepID=UPI0006A70FF6|nr:PREDICTED: uncharacterized protein LOC106331446 [Brassica oleracea var. oleracea]
MRCEVRSGDSTFFWFDNWLGTRSIIDTTGDLGLRYLCIPRQARVAEACPNEAWGMRGRGRRVFGDVYTAIENAQKPDARRGSDVILWRHNEEDFKDHFSAARTWDQIRVRGPEVPWHHLVWFTQGVPRHAFIVWLTFKDRLSTGVRMRQWGIAQGCMLCGEPDESRDHLFFACPYTFTVWSNLTATLLGTVASPDWTTMVTSLLRRNRNKMDAILLRMIFHTTIYLVWKERNSRRHLGPWVTTEAITRQIDKAIRNRISSLKYTGQHKLESLFRRWVEVYIRQ